MNFVVDKVYSFKLNSGEEIVAKVKSVDLPNIQIIDPVSVVAGQNGGLGLVPSLFTAKPSSLVTINTTSVALVAVVDENVELKYIQATTGLTMPEKKVLVG